MHNGRRLAIYLLSRKEVMVMRVTLQIGEFTVSIVIKRNNRHSDK